ncbi:MAG: LysM peptidoglycan-binding domain-containing protein [Pseudomonadota bacterium]
MNIAVFKVNHLFLLLAGTLLTACQQTPIVDAQTSEGTTSEEIIIEAQITNDDQVACNCDLEGTSANTNSNVSEGTIEVVHPITDEIVPDLPVDKTLPAEEDTPVETDLWAYIANNLEFESPKNHPRVVAQKNWYLKHPTYMRRVSNRASPFLYYIVEELEQNNIPIDIALLPIVESAFDPFAYSHGRAAGMWQFIPETGKRFGMPQNWWYDGRRDVIRSTQGAIKYLEYLHDFFDGNWLHALAAYNSGEGRVKRAIRRNKAKNKPTDFWSLDLPKETRAYVPKLLALADMLKNADNYNFKWPKIENLPVIHVVDTNRQIELNKAAEFAGVSVKEFRALNPGFNRWATPPDQKVEIVLPIRSVSDFESSLENASQDTLVTWRRHKIRRGDNLGGIANKYATSVEVIKTLNDLDDSRIIAGKHLLIPAGAVKDEGMSQIIARNLSFMQSKNQTSAGKHVVRSGDTLWDIAKEYRVSVKDLSSWNSISSKQTLKIGTELTVYQPNAIDNMTQRRVNYRVRRGDSLSRIADKFNVSVRQIINWNNLQGKKYLQPGQRLKLNVNVTAL